MTYALGISVLLGGGLYAPTHVDAEDLTLGRAGDPEDPSGSRGAPHIMLRQGATKDTVRKRFGEPDESSDPKQSGGIETWHYGASFVMFLDGEVTGWSDRGELVERENLPRNRSRTNRDQSDEFRRRGWQRIWKPEHAVSRDEVLDDLLQDEDGRIRSN
ncbi:MAG: hypothetical protein KDD44_09535 [Bdellovibrionales bacterium]|nr:hypothetical protein [Bdellovibrionales bacterium]